MYTQFVDYIIAVLDQYTQFVDYIKQLQYPAVRYFKFNSYSSARLNVIISTY